MCPVQLVKNVIALQLIKYLLSKKVFIKIWTNIVPILKNTHFVLWALQTVLDPRSHLGHVYLLASLQVGYIQQVVVIKLDKFAARGREVQELGQSTGCNPQT